MSLNPAAFIIPAVMLCIGIEYVCALKKKKQHLFKYDNSVANISVGIAERLLYLFCAATFYKIFTYIHAHYALFNIPSRWYTWVLLILLTDLVWYWYHRLGHEVNILWGAHVVHHHSEDFNYTVSARITVLQALVRNVFWCILPLIGFDADMVMVILLVHGAYSFFTHTQLIGKLGFLEKILITPSHHRVHHASNEKYLDKNYGDIFIFWDKLFGTFQAEDEQPVYGLTKPMKTYSFLWQHFHFYFQLLYIVRRTNGWKQKFSILLGKPELLDPAVADMLERKFLRHRVRKKESSTFRGYLNIQVGLCLTCLFLLTLFYRGLSMDAKLFSSVFILLTLINCGAMLEQRRWVYYLEVSRIVFLIGVYSYYIRSMDLFLFMVIVLFFTLIRFPVKYWHRRLLFGE